METSPSPAARLGLRLGVGATLLVAAAWLFGAIAEDVVTGTRITQVDADLAAWLHRHATPFVYLGVHYLSDVGAAFCEGIAWLSLCLIAIDRFWPRRHEAHHDMQGIA